MYKHTLASNKDNPDGTTKFVYTVHESEFQTCEECPVCIEWNKPNDNKN